MFHLISRAFLVNCTLIAISCPLLSCPLLSCPALSLSVCVCRAGGLSCAQVETAFAERVLNNGLMSVMLDLVKSNNAGRCVGICVYIFVYECVL